MVSGNKPAISWQQHLPNTMVPTHGSHYICSWLSALTARIIPVSWGRITHTSLDDSTPLIQPNLSDSLVVKCYVDWFVHGFVPQGSQGDWEGLWMSCSPSCQDQIPKLRASWIGEWCAYSCYEKWWYWDPLLELCWIGQLAAENIVVGLCVQITANRNKGEMIPGSDGAQSF